MNEPLFTSDQEVLDALNKASTLLADARYQRSEPIAVIGMGCRFPHANNLDAFWQLLADGGSGIGQVPEDRWNREQLTSAKPKTPGKIITDRAGFIDEIDQFDSRFFEITRREAASMDPQQRLLMEVAWRTLEHAGVRPSQMQGGSHGVFVGMCSSDYLSLLNQNEHESIDAYHGTGNAHGAAAGRLSYFLGWGGPCFSIDSACSSSLVAVHQAIGSLRNRECETALVAGVNVILTPELSINLSQAGMLSPDGQCKAFAAAANGFVRGEGCGAVLLKRLTDAIEDGDNVICCLRGSAINQDGRSNGLTAPNGLSQRAVIRDALKASNLQPADIDYIEAHGTGTELGDPIEIRALAEVFSQRDKPLKVGSVKTNIGHLEGAAGVAGLIKTCLAISRQELPRHLHFDQPSHHIDWNVPIEIADQPSRFPAQTGQPSRAGVSSFGFGGSNAHVIVEAYPQEASIATRDSDSRPLLFKLSAKSQTALQQFAASLAEHLPVASLSQIARQMNCRRDDFEHRRFLIASTRDDLLQQLHRFDAKDSNAPNADSSDASIAELLAIGKRYVAGEIIDWEAAQPTTAIAHVALPGHPFNRQRCWMKDPSASDAKLLPRSKTSAHPDFSATQPLLGDQLDIAGEHIVFETDVSEIAYLQHHRLNDVAVFPATAFIEQATAALKAIRQVRSSEGDAIVIRNLQLQRALTVNESPTRVQVLLSPDSDNAFHCSVQHRGEIGWRESAKLHVALEVADLQGLHDWHPESAENSGDASNYNIAAHYQSLSELGIQYGDAFQSLAGVIVDHDKAFGVAELPTGQDAESHNIHPALLDGCLQTLASLIPAEAAGMWLPIAADEFTLVPQDASPTKAYVICGFNDAPAPDETSDLKTRSAWLDILDDRGMPLARIRGFRIQRLASSDASALENASANNRLPGESSELAEELREIKTALSQADPETKHQLALDFAHRKVAEIGEMDLDEVELDTPLTSLGIDSIMAIELQGVLEKTLDTQVSMDLFLQDLSVRDIITAVIQQSESSDAGDESDEAEDDWVEGAL